MKVFASLVEQSLWLPYVELSTAEKHPRVQPDKTAQLLLTTLMPEQIPPLLQQYTQAEIWLSYDAAEFYIARQLKAGKALPLAIELWQAYAAQLIQLQSQHRRQLKLVNLQQCQQNPAALPAEFALKAQFASSSYMELMAAIAIKQQAGTDSLLQRLFACSQPVAEHPEYNFDVPALIKNTSTAANVTNLQKQLQEQQQSLQQTEQALQQWQQKQAELDGLLQQETAAKAEVHAQLETAMAALHQQQELNQQLQQENQLLLTQLFGVQEELERQHLLAKELQLQSGDLSQKVQSLEQQLTTSAGQLSQLKNNEQQNQRQLTEQSKNITQLEQDKTKMQQQLHAASEENQLILEQLFKVQEELERYYQQLQQHKQQATYDLQRFNHSEAAKEAQYQRDLNKLEGQLRKLKARAASAEHQAELVQKELRTIKGSALWKTAAPVRAMKQLVNKKQHDKERLQQQVALILTSEYFDIDWYLQTYPDVAAGSINPAEHYLRFGAAEGRMPGPLFDGSWYMQRYPDVAEAGINPLLHFVKFGQQEGRSTSPKFLQNTQFKDSEHDVAKPDDTGNDTTIKGA